MSDKNQTNGLNPSFDLQNSIAAASTEDIMPVAVSAANRLREEFYTDKKTGLRTEAAWRDSLTRSIDSLQNGDELVVSVADLDRFKEVNDTLGHDAGDELLGIVGNVFKQVYKRESDTVAHGSREEDGGDENIARLGGDEFSVVSIRRAGENSRRTTTADEQADIQEKRLAEGLKSQLKGTKFESFGTKLSVGSAVYQPGDTAEAVFAKADLAMLNNKYQGRIDALTPADLRRAKRVVPFLLKIGSRVEPWLKQAVNAEEAA